VTLGRRILATVNETATARAEGVGGQWMEEKPEPLAQACPRLSIRAAPIQVGYCLALHRLCNT